MTTKATGQKWINAADPRLAQQQGTMPALAVVASVIAIVAARMAANINFLMNLTSFAAQTAPACGHTRAQKVARGGCRERERRVATAGHRTPTPRSPRPPCAPAPYPALPHLLTSRG